MPSASASLGLFLFGGTPEFEGDSLNLFTVGSTQSGIYSGVDLYVECGDDGNIKEAELPLFVAAPSSGYTTAGMNLYLDGWYSHAESSLELTCWNDQVGVTGALTLYTRGYGVTAGAMPVTTNISLVCKSDPREMIPLYVQGPGEVAASGVDFYCKGVESASDEVDLFCAGVGVSESSVRLFTHGY